MNLFFLNHADRTNIFPNLCGAAKACNVLCSRCNATGEPDEAESGEIAIIHHPDDYTKYYDINGGRAPSRRVKEGGLLFLFSSSGAPHLPLWTEVAEGRVGHWVLGITRRYTNRDAEFVTQEEWEGLLNWAIAFYRTNHSDSLCQLKRPELLQNLLANKHLPLICRSPKSDLELAVLCVMCETYLAFGWAAQLAAMPMASGLREKAIEGLGLDSDAVCLEAFEQKLLELYPKDDLESLWGESRDCSWWRKTIDDDLTEAMIENEWGRQPGIDRVEAFVKRIQAGNTPEVQEVVEVRLALSVRLKASRSSGRSS